MPISKRIRLIPVAIAFVGAILVFGVFAPLGQCDNQVADKPPSEKPEPAEVMPASTEDMWRDQQTLTRYVKDKKALNSQIVQYLDLVSKAYIDFPIDETARAQSEKERADFRKKTEKILFKALTLARVRDQQNQRGEVNRQAAVAIGSLAQAYPGVEGEAARERLAKKLLQTVERLEKVRYDLEPETLVTAFAALSEFGSLTSLEWMLEEFSHTKSVDQDWLVAAHRAMVRFPVTAAAAEKSATRLVPGKLRHEIVREFIKSYTAVETAANTSSNLPGNQAKKRFWDEVKNTAIPVLQHFAHQPRNPETGEALATVREFQRWFRDHKNARKAPWTEPK